MYSASFTVLWKTYLNICHPSFLFFCLFSVSCSGPKLGKASTIFCKFMGAVEFYFWLQKWRKPFTDNQKPYSFCPLRWMDELSAFWYLMLMQLTLSNTISVIPTTLFPYPLQETLGVCLCESMWALSPHNICHCNKRVLQQILLWKTKRDFSGCTLVTSSSTGQLCLPATIL